jgi:hypothetical protein
VSGDEESEDRGLPKKPWKKNQKMLTSQLDELTVRCIALRVNQNA